MSDKKLINEFRCLRMHLAPLLTADKAELLQRVEERLKSPGSVSTGPALSSKRNQGTRKTKKQIFNKYFFQ